jgi:hypothetical protein
LKRWLGILLLGSAVSQKPPKEISPHPIYSGSEPGASAGEFFVSRRPPDNGLVRVADKRFDAISTHQFSILGQNYVFQFLPLLALHLLLPFHLCLEHLLKVELHSLAAVLVVCLI